MLLVWPARCFRQDAYFRILCAVPMYVSPFTTCLAGLFHASLQNHHSMAALVALSSDNKAPTPPCLVYIAVAVTTSKLSRLCL